MGGGTLHVMTSAGGLVRAASFRPKDGLLSGPAGGVVGAALAGRRSGLPPRHRLRHGRHQHRRGALSTATSSGCSSTGWGTALLAAPALAIESVAAGGGSICGFERGELQVGPESAGACARAGLLRRRRPADADRRQPAPRPAGGRALRDPARRARRRSGPCELLAARARRDCGREALLAGFLEIADERMAEAIRRISVRRGYDPPTTRWWPSAAPAAQHACAVAGLLGIGTVLVPGTRGSSRRSGSAPRRSSASPSVRCCAPLAEVAALVPGWLEDAGGARPRQRSRRRACRPPRSRCGGACSTCASPARRRRSRWTMRRGPRSRTPSPRRYRALYGYAPEGRAIELESIRAHRRLAADGRAAASGAGRGVRGRARAAGDAPGSAAEWAEVPVFEREALAPGAGFRGPALVLERHSATVVEPGGGRRWTARGRLVLEPRRDPTGRR